MSGRRRFRAFRSYPAEVRSTVLSNPRRSVLVVSVGLALTWLVLTKSLAYALAEPAPEWALWLNPNLPRALLGLADRERDKLVSTHTGTEAASKASAATPGVDALPDRQALRQRIRELALRAIANAPLNARGFRLLAEVTDNQAEVRFLMQEAFKRSRRESTAVLWLMNDSFSRNDFADVIAKGDVLLRTRAQLAPVVMDFFSRVIVIPEARGLLVSLLAGKPKWRGTFFNTLPKIVRDDDALLELMVALKDIDGVPSTQELEPYLDSLVNKRRVDFAYNAWLQLMPQEKLASLGLLHNPSFAENPSGLPFDWSIKRGHNAMVDFVALPDARGERAVRYRFGYGRAKFPETSQILMLPPGPYHLEGALRGLLNTRRGLRWELRCRGGQRPLAETDMIYGNPQHWQNFVLNADVPDQDDCRAQTLRLYHPARSASEELISGEISFRGIRLARVKECLAEAPGSCPEPAATAADVR